MLQSPNEGLEAAGGCRCLLWGKKLGGVPLHCRAPDRDLPPMARAFRTQLCLQIFGVATSYYSVANKVRKS